ncbi:ATP-dependent DNA helicase chl1 [Microsporum canis]|uniref:ATP-dependent DNA helicase CHL1 n=1 Tax=Arthroderma otae (strain ATCC MYA-4605 / CBS 113480) TaxID=554155 RepID=C5FZW6_ARTOC|nr:DEAD_2 domain-containing protein [Microsporum canis CBS 113480]EEQ35419.1 DEAD_2 domain-containing protein [Microsporum canis CBS 113480]
MERDFRHPYRPYDIQAQFMEALYGCIEDGGIGIFESPTGESTAGKSLSLICGSLAWLRHHKRSVFLEKADDDDDGEPDWMVQHARRERTRELLARRKELEDRLARVREAEERHRKKLELASRSFKKMRVDEKARSETREEDFELDDYESGDETAGRPQDDTSPLSADTLALLERLKGPVRQAEDDDEETVKIIYCSRTHSQLIQFAQEMRRVLPVSSVPPDLDEKQDEKEGENEKGEWIKHTPLASRKALCINPSVRSLASATAINERCLEIQRPNVAAEHRCPYLPADNELKTSQFQDHLLARVSDIEDLPPLGTRIGICPYYATRTAMRAPATEVVTLPYPLLLQQSAREALNLSAKKSVIIIDEAHNLVDAIVNIHSVAVSLAQLRTALAQITTYAKRFKTRLRGRNRVYIAQLIRLVGCMVRCLEEVAAQTDRADGELKVQDVLGGGLGKGGADMINPHKLGVYLRESKLARKVDGYIEHTTAQAGGGMGAGRKGDGGMPVLFHVQSFLLPLMDPSDEGRLFYEKASGDVQMKYLLLDPTSRFRELVEDARAVILAGGTMEPMDDYVDHLLSYVPREKVKTFTYGHVIPKDNLIAIPVARGMDNVEFNFTFDQRQSEKMITSLGQMIARFCSVIPDGVVVFFPSYDYLATVLRVWSSTSGVLDNLSRLKPIFHEAPSDSSGSNNNNTNTNTDSLLQQYSASIDAGKGGLLLSVMGGKLSEGINFSDALGRGVIVVGLPFPNTRNAIWQAKLQHVERRAYDLADASLSAAERRARGKQASRAYYENTCMRTVNQCIGRAIRHKEDYAAILMIDKRYQTERIQGKLPGWIRGSLRPQSVAHQQLQQLFSNKS